MSLVAVGDGIVVGDAVASGAVVGIWVEEPEGAEIRSKISTGKLQPRVMQKMMANIGK
jgi:hypothetical protein